MSFAFYAAALLPVAVLGVGLTIPEDNRMVQQAGLIRYPIIPQQGNLLFGKHSNFTKRQTDTGISGQRSGTIYTIELTLGTPGQKVPVQFDTGSAELWVNPVCSQSNTPEYCAAQPRFTESSTLVDLDQQGSVVYGTGYANFEYVADYVAVGSAKITQQIFGVAYDSAHAVLGIMGAGPDLNGWDSGYPLVVDSLAEQGFTNSRAFSMDLKGLDSARGSVIFGGIDTKKYSGNLIKRPIIPAAESPDKLTRFWVYVNGISVNQPDGNVVTVYTTPAGGKGQPVLLDSGYTLSALPAPIMEKLVSAFPSAQYDAEADMYIVDCLDPGKGGSLDFTFGDDVINVRYYDFVWHYPDTNLCVLGAFADDFPVLGDTFLRSAYVVYDWDNRMIHLGQSDDCGSKLVAIGSGPDAVPSIAGECAQSTPSSTSTSSRSTSTSSSTRSTSATVTKTSKTSSAASSKKSTASETSSTSEPTSTTDQPSTSTSSKTAVTSKTVSRSTITITSATTSTITSCPPTVTHCTAGQVTTKIITKTTTVCPETTGTYTFPRTVTCNGDNDSSCPSGSTRTTTLTVTVSPLPPTERTTHVVPGCTTNPSITTSTTLVTALPTGDCVGCPPGGHGGNWTITAAAKPPIVTAGGAKVGVVYGAMGFVGGLMAVIGL